MLAEKKIYYVNFKKLVLNLGKPCKCQEDAVCICDSMKTKKNCICQFILNEEEFLDNKSILKENMTIMPSANKISKEITKDIVVEYFRDEYGALEVEENDK